MSALVPPEALKQIKPYITLASQLDNKEDKCIPYYCRAYAVETGMHINKTAPECKKFLFQIMDTLEKTKAENKNDESITNNVVGQACVEKYALSIFQRADDDDRQGRFSKNLVKQFYSAGLLFDVLSYFGELSEDLAVKKQYAKQKAMYLNKCFQTGETPKPGPLVDDDGSNQLFGFVGGDTGAGASAGFGGSPSAPYPSTSGGGGASITTVSSTTVSFSQPSSSYNNAAAAETVSGDVTLTPDEFAKAQKFCKFALSALQYEDVPTAITNLESCLKLLKTGK